MEVQIPVHDNNALRRENERATEGREGESVCEGSRVEGSRVRVECGAGVIQFFSCVGLGN